MFASAQSLAATLTVRHTSSAGAPLAGSMMWCMRLFAVAPATYRGAGCGKSAARDRDRLARGVRAALRWSSVTCIRQPACAFCPWGSSLGAGPAVEMSPPRLTSTPQPTASWMARAARSAAHALAVAPRSSFTPRGILSVQRSRSSSTALHPAEQRCADAWRHCWGRARLLCGRPRSQAKCSRATACRGHSRRARVPLLLSDRRLHLSARRRVGPASTASINSESTRMVRPARALTRISSESSRKRLQARSTSSSWRSRIACACAKASSSRSQRARRSCRALAILRVRVCVIRITIRPRRPAPIPVRARVPARAPLLWRGRFLRGLRFLRRARILLRAPLPGRAPRLPRAGADSCDGRGFVAGSRFLAEAFRGERSVPGSCSPSAPAPAAEAILRWSLDELSVVACVCARVVLDALRSCRGRLARRPRRTRRSMPQSPRPANGWRCSTCAVPRLWRVVGLCGMASGDGEMPRSASKRRSGGSARLPVRRPRPAHRRSR